MKGKKRKQIKKLILLLLIILIFNIIASNLFPAVAATEQAPTDEDTTTSSGLGGAFDEGEKQFKGDSNGATLLEGIVGVLTWPLRILVIIGGVLLQTIATAI